VTAEPRGRDEAPLGDAPLADAFLADAAEVRRAMEYYADKGWTDGLPVVPVTESYLKEFLAVTSRDPAEVLIPMPHLNKALTVRLAAINAALAGCRPEYFPVVLAAWDAFRADGMVTRSIWQSTTGTAPFVVVNGPVRTRIGLNCKGNVFGSGFRANATIGRAIRLGAINGLGLRPHVLDQATQGTPAKYVCCIGENEEDSPWPPLHADHGFGPGDSAVAATVIRSVLHVEARHSTAPEQLAHDFADSLCRTAALVRPAAAGYIVLNPEHARLCDRHGWSKADLSRAIYELGVKRYGELRRAGKEAIAAGTNWRLPAGHPDALPHTVLPDEEPVRLIAGPEAVHIVVAGAPNAGVSSIVETFTRLDGPPAFGKVEPPPSPA
jgi:hypothetical protein